MNKYIKVLLIVILLIISILIFTPLFGSVYEMQFGSLNSIGLLSVSTGGILKFIIGFMISYVLFVPLIVSFFSVKPIKYYLILSLVGLPLLFIVFNSNITVGIQIIIPFILIAGVGWGIGELIAFLYKKLRK